MSYPKSLRDALDGIIDYAGLFPPAALDVQHAVKEYAQLRRQAQGRWLADKFVFPVWPDAKRETLLHEFGTHGEVSGEPFPVAILLPGLKNPADTQLGASLLERYGLQMANSIFSDAGLRLSSVEFAVPDGFEDESDADWDDIRIVFGRMSAQEYPLPVYLEFDWRTWTSERAFAIQRLREIHPGIGVKIRTGGLTPDMVPPFSILSQMISTLIECRVPFKCTAGLHSALYEVSPRFGFEMHGFMNLAALTLALMKGAQADTAEHILSIGEASRLDTAMSRLVSQDWLDSLSQARSFFHSFGSCSVSEPLESLAAHGYHGRDCAEA